MRIVTLFLVVLLLLLAGPLVTLAGGEVSLGGDWRTASHDPVGIAPDPATDREAIVQVYAARAFSWRGAFGVHTWVAVKQADAPAFTVLEIIGWRTRGGGDGLVVSQRPADARWYGATPRVIAELRGAEAAAAIPRILEAARAYPYRLEYRVWPGPNSNTFTAWIGRHVPALRLDLPPTAVGKDFLPNGDFVAEAPSGTGWQVSLFGVIGLLAAVEEGIEINLLALTFGVDPLDLAIKLPGVGRIGALP